MNTARKATVQARGAEAGASDRDSGATRQCAVSRNHLPVEALIRFVVGPDEAVVPDLKRRLPGRGVWLACQRETVDAAVEKGHFSRAFKRRVKASPELADLVEHLLRQAALSRLSLANKAGAVTCGFAKVEQAIGKGRVAGLVHASARRPATAVASWRRWRGKRPKKTVPPCGSFAALTLTN